MKTIKVAEATELQLDWLVAKCAGTNWRIRDGKVISLTPVPCPDDRAGCIVAHFACTVFAPSTDWAQGGPIIERENISVGYQGHLGVPLDSLWYASNRVDACGFGQTPLIAALRCFVAGKLGPTVELPEELVP